MVRVGPGKLLPAGAGTKVKGGEEIGRFVVGDVNVFCVVFGLFRLAFAGLQEKMYVHIDLTCALWTKGKKEKMLLWFVPVPSSRVVGLARLNASSI